MINKIKNKSRKLFKNIYNKNINLIDLVFGFYQNNSSIVYLDKFMDKDKDLLSLHYAKSNWFFKDNDIINYSVYLFVSSDKLKPNKLSFMDQDTSKTIFLQKKGYIQKIFKTKNILIWNSQSSLLKELLYIIIYLLTGKRIFNVNIHDIKAKEYNVYAKLPWIILSKSKKQHFIAENKKKLYDKIINLKNKRHDKTYIIANGPSLETIFDIKVDDGYKIVANSIIRNIKMIEYIKPDFIVAGDPLWHFGASIYSKKFRKDILNIIDKYSDTLFVFPADQGLSTYINMVAARKNIVLIPYGAIEPNYNLMNDFYIPPFTSVINALMIPLGSTLSDELYILGSDGKVKHIPNEDFWAHAGEVQYPEKYVKAGHLSSPTFDINRKSHDEISHVENILTNIINIGENKYHKKFYSLSKITTFKVMKNRTINEDEV